MTWASTVKDTPVPMSYKLESIEELFTKRYMSNYDINYDKINGRIREMKLPYCNYLRDQGETDSCIDLIPYIEIEGKEINGSLGKTPAGVSKSTCINLCLSNDERIEAEFFTDDGICEMNHHETSHTISTNLEAMLMIFTSKLKLSERNLVFTDAKIIPDVNCRSSKNVNRIDDCHAECDNDQVCMVFTFCDLQTAVASELDGVASTTLPSTG